MTVGIANATEDKLLNSMRAGGTTCTVVAGTYVKLHVGDPGVAGANNAAAGSTTRVAVTQAASSGGNGLVMNGTPPTWTNGGTTETITHISVWDASSAGTFQYSVLLTTPQAWVSGNTGTLSGLTFTLNPNAA
jgi:hypothetical protein